MSTSSLKILCRYQYDPLDRLTGVGLLERASTQRFYQQDHLTTELGEQTQRTIIRHEARPLAQQQSTAGVTATTLLATDQAHSVLHTLVETNPQQLAYTAYGHHPAESGLSHLLGFNGECPEEITGHYLLGQGTRAFNPVLMRFTSPDELSPFSKGGINCYAYCQGDPINFNDPTGNVRFKIPVPRKIVRILEGRIQKPRYAIEHAARPSRPAAISDPVATTPSANAQKRLTSRIPDEGAPRSSARRFDPTYSRDYSYTAKQNKREVARKFDEMRKNPDVEKKMDPELVKMYESADNLARDQLTNLVPKENYTVERRNILMKLQNERHRIKGAIVTKLGDDTQKIRNQ
ncbi:hypothetical protein PS838_01025 [Pseudomonas fluorescens]|jgi:RHS repeat-associated protein|nr:hypothetical protein PS838_01025 [Pseudomonas fluorescens]